MNIVHFLFKFCWLQLIYLQVCFRIIILFTIIHNWFKINLIKWILSFTYLSLGVREDWIILTLPIDIWFFFVFVVSMKIILIHLVSIICIKLYISIRGPAFCWRRLLEPLSSCCLPGTTCFNSDCWRSSGRGISA